MEAFVLIPLSNYLELTSSVSDFIGSSAETSTTVTSPPKQFWEGSKTKPGAGSNVAVEEQLTSAAAQSNTPAE